MKTPILFSLALALAASAQAPAGWVNFIRQRQVNTGVIWDMPVQPNGQSASQLTLESSGALFQLWTIRQKDSVDFLLDQKLVGAYLPSAAVRIKTSDPYPHLHRTRADQPFTVETDVAGLLSGPGIPDAAKQVLMEHHLAPYAPGQTSIDPRVATGGTPASSGMITSNGTTVLTFPGTKLAAKDPTKAVGEEHFVIHALADADALQSRIASNFVQIWPVSSGRIEGISSGERIRHSVPQLKVVLDDLYPSSATWLQIYPGNAALGKAGDRVDGSVIILDQDRSENRLVRIKDWGNLLKKDGPHTIEIITETPFGVERLSYIEFMVDRQLSVNATLGNLEVSKP